MKAFSWITCQRGRLWDACFAAGFAALFLRLHGLPIGVGNQSLHLAWIRHLQNPEAFARDPLVDSFSHFPSFFFQIFARLIPPGISVETALQCAQVLNTFLLFWACIRLARTLTPGSHWSWLAPVFFLLAPTRALAETPLPPIAFSHTAFGLTLAVAGLNAVFQDRLKTAAVLFALLANVHLLTAAYAGSIAAAYVLTTLRKSPLTRFILPVLIGLVLCSPVLLNLLQHAGANYDEEWLTALRIRSAHHVFPHTWWRTGDTVIGHYVLMLGWLGILLSILHKQPGATARWMMLLPPLLLIGIGAFAAFVSPAPLLLRGQFFRASLFPLLLLFLAAPGAAEKWIRSTRLPTAALLCCMGTAAVFWIPSLSALQVPALAIASIALWWTGDLKPLYAAALLPIFPLLALSDRMLETTFLQLGALPTPNLMGVTLLLAFLLIGAAKVLQEHQASAYILALFGAGLGFITLPYLSTPRVTADDWTEIQLLTKALTPPDARILTPTRRAGFRDGSHRSIVGEWRDGTMQFFDPAYAAVWNERMNDLSPERTKQFTPDDWVVAGERYQAEYAVLPIRQAVGLQPMVRTREWALVRTERIPPPPLPDPPENAIASEDWLKQERFVREVVEPNIAANRVRSTTLVLTEPGGIPLQGLPLEVEQTRLGFGVGSALHHFFEVPKRQKGFNAPLNHPRELELFTEIFNFSVIGYSGKWYYIETEPGKRDYKDLDAYVEWCTKRDIRIQYHFVTGYEPDWMRRKPAGFRKKALMIHANDLIDRYGDRIDEWQVINERRMQSDAPDVFKLFRERQPDDRLGVSHCARFYTDREGEKGEMDLKRGWRSMEQILGAGQDVDFFAIHAHRPFGILSDPRTMYKVLDDFQEKGVRITVSETGIPHTGEIKGSVLRGNWDPELQAEQLVRYYKILYSHPNVDAINFWGFGPRTWQKGIGLLDNNYEPLPAFHALKRLVKEEWGSGAEGRSGRGGEFAFTGHRGQYQVTIRHPDGRTGVGTFELDAEPREQIPVSIQWR